MSRSTAVGRPSPNGNANPNTPQTTKRRGTQGVGTHVTCTIATDRGVIDTRHSIRCGRVSVTLLSSRPLPALDLLSSLGPFAVNVLFGGNYSS